MLSSPTMSRAFTKEDSWEEPVVPPRAALPPGVPNYVTPRGLALLHAEHAQREAQRARLDADTPDEAARRKHRAVLTRQLGDLAARIASAEVVDPALQESDRVRFGATVTLRTIRGEQAGEVRTLQIVGVDEADPGQGRVAFLAPIARAVIGHAPGDVVQFQAGDGEATLAIEAVTYGEPAP
ncbi:MAG: GreA/GreB family elongation factor [Candidatus Eisenbacteria bacterium]